MYGLQINQKHPGTCYETVELIYSLVNEAFELSQQIFYEPKHITNIMLVQNDITDTFASVQANCESEVFITNFAGLWSLQGIMEFIVNNVFSIPDWTFMLLNEIA